jgi:uncharacterized membrane protein
LYELADKKSVLVFLIINESLVVLGVVLLFFSIQNGPVSLVSTIAGSRPMFVFIFAIAINYVRPVFLEARLTTKMLVLRVTAIAMIVAGISIIQLVR